jgi:hypothetical protein
MYARMKALKKSHQALSNQNIPAEVLMLLQGIEAVYARGGSSSFGKKGKPCTINITGRKVPRTCCLLRMTR